MASLLSRALHRTSYLLHELANSVFYRWSGGENRPVFYDARETFPELLRIDENIDVIREEFETVLQARERIPRYHHVDLGQHYLSPDSGDKAWRTFFVHMCWAGKDLPTRSECPRTAEVVESIPHVLQSFFSILEPGTDVPQHNGPSMNYLRYHTAVRVPRENPPTLRVRDQYYTWKEGASLLFDDSWNHEVFNESKELRAVLVVDVLRPLPLPLHWFNRFLLRLRIPTGVHREVVLKRVALEGAGAMPKVTA